MTGSFRVWMEALRMRGNLLVLHGVASTTMVVGLEIRLGEMVRGFNFALALW